MQLWKNKVPTWHNRQSILLRNKTAEENKVYYYFCLKGNRFNRFMLAMNRVLCKNTQETENNGCPFLYCWNFPFGTARTSFSMFKKPSRKHNFMNNLKNWVGLYSYPFLLLLTITRYPLKDVRLCQK